MASSKSRRTHAFLLLSVASVALLVAAVDVDAQPLAPGDGGPLRRERRAVSNTAKRKMEQEVPFVDSSNISSEGKRDKDHGSEPLVSNDDLLEWYKELVQDRDLVVQQLRAYESRISVHKEYLRQKDLQLKEIVEASAEKKLDQAVRKLASAPW